jgi:class 3 adenylate cyclase
MRECPACFSDVPPGATATCPSCGAALSDMRTKSEWLEIDGKQGKGTEGDGTASGSHPASLWESGLALSVLPDPRMRRSEDILASARTEARRATVMLADLCDFFQMGARLSAEDLSRLASEFYRICSACILGRGGFVVKFMGEAVLTVFGAPVSRGHDTVNAVSAALDLRTRLRATRLEKTGRMMDVALGLATGTVQSGPIATPSGRRYDVLGDTVNLAARLQASASAGEIVTCPVTRDDVSDVFEFEPTAPLRLKNIAEDYVAYRVVSEHAPLPAPAVGASERRKAQERRS